MRQKIFKFSNLFIIGIIVVIGIVLFIYSQENAKQIEDKDANNKDMIKIRLYDKDGNLIGTQQTLSVVNGVSGVGFIDITVSATNDGAIPLSCEILGGSVTPSIFDTALSKNIKSLPVGSRVEWTSNLIQTSNFEGLSQPTRFRASVRCSYSDASGFHYLDQGGYFDATIIREGNASFKVQIGQGGVPSEYCGDNVCQTYETANSCPSDCGIISKAKFRTSDQSYILGSAVAYTSSCGAILNRYGFDSTTSCWTITDATCPVRIGYTLALPNIPGRPLWAGTNIGCLYTNNADSTKVTLAWKTTTSTNSPCSSIGQWGIINYDSDDPDKTKVSESYISFNTLKEVIC